MTEHTLPDEKYFIELHSPEWNAAILKMFGGSVRGCTICGHPFKQGLSCDHCGEMSPHVSLNSRNANGYPDVAVYPRAPIQAAQDYLHEGRGFNCGWCGQRFAETQHGKFCANSDCTKSPSYKPTQATQVCQCTKGVTQCLECGACVDNTQAAQSDVPLDKDFALVAASIGIFLDKERNHDALDALERIRASKDDALLSALETSTAYMETLVDTNSLLSMKVHTAIKIQARKNRKAIAAAASKVQG
jgi:hypothetical protein